jgi:hypothetical protein
MATPAQNLSREMILLAYKAAISPGSLPSSLYFCRESSTNRPFFVQTNPISKKPENTLTSFMKKGYERNVRFSPTKTNPNEPKQSQSDPHFSPVIAPQSQNEPKQTQSKANRTRSEVEIPMGQLLEILKPGTKQTQFLCTHCQMLRRQSREIYELSCRCRDNAEKPQNRITCISELVLFAPRHKYHILGPKLVFAPFEYEYAATFDREYFVLVRVSVQRRMPGCTSNIRIAILSAPSSFEISHLIWTPSAPSTATGLLGTSLVFVTFMSCSFAYFPLLN